MTARFLCRFQVLANERWKVCLRLVMVRALHLHCSLIRSTPWQFFSLHSGIGILPISGTTQRRATAQSSASLPRRTHACFQTTQVRQGSITKSFFVCKVLTTWTNAIDFLFANPA